MMAWEVVQMDNIKLQCGVALLIPLSNMVTARASTTLQGLFNLVCTHFSQAFNVNLFQRGQFLQRIALLLIWMAVLVIKMEFFL